MLRKHTIGLILRPVKRLGLNRIDYTNNPGKNPQAPDIDAKLAEIESTCRFCYGSYGAYSRYT